MRQRGRWSPATGKVTAGSRRAVSMRGFLLDRETIWAGLIGAALSTAGMPARAHDVYTGLYDRVGQICCGGDPHFGDCEPLREDQVAVHPDGSVTMQSRRYGTSITVGAPKVTWLPVRGSDAPAHWCGVPRTRIELGPVDDENPDPGYWTYCAFVTPGGM